MLKFNKFLSLTLIFAVSIVSSKAALGEIVDTYQNGTDFYLVESLNDTYTLYHYDMTANGTTVTTLFTLDGEPTAFTYDGVNFYAAYNNSLWEIDDTTGVATFIRNINTPAKRLFSVGNYLVVLLGSPDNVVKTYSKADGTEGDQTPLLANDIAPIADIFLANATQLIIQLDAANEAGVQFFTASLDGTAGTLGDLTADADPSPNLRPTGIGAPFYLDDFDMVTDSVGNVANLRTSSFVLAHGESAEVTLYPQLGDFGDIPTDSVIHAAADDATYVYTAMTLDNECNPVEPGGNRISRHIGFDTDEDRGLWINYYYDTPSVVHTLAANNETVYLFSGEGSSIGVEAVGDEEFENPIWPWRPTTYDPTQEPLDSANQSLSFALKDGVTIAMQIDYGCDHHLVFWNTSTQTFSGFTDTYWPGAVSAAYSTTYDEIYLAFSGTDSPVIRQASSVTAESNDSTYVAADTRLNTDSLNIIVAAGQYIMANTSEGVIIGQPRDDSPTDPLEGIVFDEENPTTEEDLEGCCGTWTSAIFNEDTGQLIYTTAEGLFAFNFDGSSGAISGPLTESPDYAKIQPTTDEPYLSLNDDGTRLFLDGEIYNATTLRIIDSMDDTVAEAGFFVGNDLFTIDIGGSTLQPWTLNADGLLTKGSTVTLSNNINVLLPVTSGTTTVPVTVADNEDSTITLVVNGDTSSAATIGATSQTGGGSPDGDSGATDDTDTDTDDSSSSSDDCPSFKSCAKAPGGGSGGPLDTVLLSGLLGLAIRVYYKRYH